MQQCFSQHTVNTLVQSPKSCMSAKKPQQIWKNPISTRCVNLSSALKVGRKHDMLHTPSPSVSTANPVGSSTSVPILFAACDKPELSSHLFSLKDTLFFREGGFYIPAV